MYASKDKVYFADVGNHRIRAIDFATGHIDTVAGGNGDPVRGGSSADIGDGLDARRDLPGALEEPRVPDAEVRPLGQDPVLDPRARQFPQGVVHGGLSRSRRAVVGRRALAARLIAPLPGQPQRPAEPLPWRPLP